MAITNHDSASVHMRPAGAVFHQGGMLEVLKGQARIRAWRSERLLAMLQRSEQGVKDVRTLWESRKREVQAAEYEAA